MAVKINAEMQEAVQVGLAQAKLQQKYLEQISFFIHTNGKL